MTRARWLFAAVSFALAIACTLYIVVWSRPSTPLNVWPSAEMTVRPWAITQLTLLAIALLELGARGLKVRLSAAALRIPMTYSIALRASAGGDFGAAITPARTGAEPARFLIMTEAGMPSAHIILVIFAELFLEMICLALISAAMFLRFRSSGSMILGMVGLVAMYAVLVLGTGALGFQLSRRHSSGPPPPWARYVGLDAGRWRRIQKSLRQLRDGIEGMKNVRWGAAVAALLASLAHVALRLAILPVIVYAFVHRPLTDAEIAPLILWPIALTYGGVVAPVPAGGGAIEWGFKAALGTAIPAVIFGAALIWWRFYTFYIYVILGAIVAGDAVLRALRDDGASEDEAAITGAAAATASGP